MDLKMDFSNGKHDLLFVDGECPTTSDAIDRVIQRLYIRLRTFYGEWWLDTEYGVPWLERILGQKVRKEAVDIILQEQILQESEVAEVFDFSSTLDVPSRFYQCKFRVRATSGETSRLIVI